jgi:hypothetical protein
MEAGLKMHKTHRFPIGIRASNKLILSFCRTQPDWLTNLSFVTVVAATVGASGAFVAWCFGAFN